ncbi:MAG: SGNH/GDSL hydrolase family protein, partial [Myxococcota bacterium]
MLLIVGDSIALGTNMSEPVGPAFPELLARRITGSVQGLGCAGTTALDWHPHSKLAVPECRSTLQHYRDLVTPELPARVVGVLLGTNDATGFLEPDHLPVSAEQYRWAITHLSSRLNSARLHLSYEENDLGCELAEAVVADHPEDADARAVLGEA